MNHTVRRRRAGLAASRAFSAAALPGAVLLAAMLFAAPAAFLGAESADSILERAASYLGTPYRHGGTSPGGFDCSGFVYYLFRPSLPSIPRMSRDMARTGSAVGAGEWRPGDLLFYATGSEPGRINHVAIWYGDGYVIHSISDGPETGVVVTPADSRYWSRRYVGSRRILAAAAADPSPPGPGEGKTAGGGGSDAEKPVPGPPPVRDIVGDEDPNDSPWNDFDGFLRGDYEAWRKADQEAFEEFLQREAGAN